MKSLGLLDLYRGLSKLHAVVIDFLVSRKQETAVPGIK